MVHPKAEKPGYAGRGPSQRQLRVGELIRKAMVEVFERVTLRDPDLSDVPITVSEVSVSPDLKAATVFVMPLGGKGRGKVIAGLTRAAPYLRGQIAQRITLRHMPQLMFQIDTAFDASSHVNKLLQTVEPEYGWTSENTENRFEGPKENGDGA